MVANIICFIITGVSLISHWCQMKDLGGNVKSEDLKTQLGIVFKLFIIMGIPWTCDIVSAAVSYTYGTGKTFEIRLLLDILNLLTGVLIFVSLVCKLQVVKSIKTTLTSSSSFKTVLSSKSSNSSATGLPSRKISTSTLSSQCS